MGILIAGLLVLLGLIPSFAWFVFYAREDVKHPEPKSLIFYTFILGGAVTFLVLVVQVFLNRVLPTIGVGNYSFISFLVLATVEEAAKFGVVFFFIHKLKDFDEPLHAMIYMIVAALGFAAVENIASLFQAANGSLLNIAIVESLTLRFIGATLLHTLTSGFVGYCWSVAFVRGARGFTLRHEGELNPLFKGLFIAALLHAVFNYLIIKTGPATLAIIFVLLVGLFLLSDFEKLKKQDI